jgi:hypothetical protein
MKGLRAVSFILFLLHVSALYGLKTCFFHGSHEAHSHASEHVHQNGYLPDEKRPDTVDCAEAPHLLAFSGRTAAQSLDRGSFISFITDVFLGPLVIVKSSFPKSPPSLTAGLPPYLLLSVFRI